MPVIVLAAGTDGFRLLEHKIDGAIELYFGFCEHALAVVGVARGIRGFNLRNKLAHPLLLDGEPWCRRSGGLWRNRSLKRRRGGLHGLASWPCGVVSRRATRKRQQEQDARWHQECAAYA